MLNIQQTLQEKVLKSLSLTCFHCVILLWTLEDYSEHHSGAVFYALILLLRFASCVLSYESSVMAAKICGDNWNVTEWR